LFTADAATFIARFAAGTTVAARAFARAAFVTFADVGAAAATAFARAALFTAFAATFWAVFAT
jgi:hypothetical protein